MTRKPHVAVRHWLRLRATIRKRRAEAHIAAVLLLHCNEPSSISITLKDAFCSGKHNLAAIL